jgi:predicted GH43/DUF377 family glycosyl hydrolase
VALSDRPWLRTPHKKNELVVCPSYHPGDFDSHAVDCPFLFFHEGRYYMTYVGWDSLGYRTGLASSADLETWHKEGLILDRGPRGSVTEYNAAMTNILRDNELYGPGTLKRVSGRFVGSYHAYPNPGYEAGPAVIGLCFSDNLHTWEISDPILRPDPQCAWEAGGLYKSWLMEHEGVYYLFYNAKNRTAGNWIEQTGLATSTDLLNWQRSPANPLIQTGPRGAFDDIFASDPCVLHHDGQWILFYFGNCSDGHARDSAAISADLLSWEKTDEVLLDIGAPGSIDATHAHKPGMMAHHGKLYHFYCAVAPLPANFHAAIIPSEIRGISFAHS